MSIKKIATLVGVVQATASVWCRDIKLSDEQVNENMRLAKNGRLKGQLLGAAANRKKKEEQISRFRADGREELGQLNKRESLLLGLGLYWGEGVKADKSSTAVVNSDPKIILTMLRWFRENFQVPDDMFSPQIFISELHRSREQVLLDYWSDILRLPRAQFRRVVFLHRTNKKAL